jgi:hypothetical protein
MDWRLEAGIDLVGPGRSRVPDPAPLAGRRGAVRHAFAVLVLVSALAAACTRSAAPRAPARGPRRRGRSSVERLPRGGAGAHVRRGTREALRPPRRGPVRDVAGRRHGAGRLATGAVSREVDAGGGGDGGEADPDLRPAERGRDITIRGCVITENNNGIFTASGDEEVTLSRDLSIEANDIFANGSLFDYYEHNVYNEASNVRISSTGSRPAS